MRAAVYKNYGPPEMVKLAEVPKPKTKTNEVLVKVCSSTVNRTDSGFRSAEYFISRFWSGLLTPKFPILGCEFSGIVESVGAEVSVFKVGDKVFGFNDRTFGGHAEYLVIPESSAICLLPNGMDFSEAAALTEGAHYALVNIRAAKVREGQNILVYGATGSIGSAAVQLLKHFGARVTAVCKGENTQVVKSLGADLVIDYETEDFTKAGETYDFIFDAVGKSSYRACKPILKNKGVYISTELGKNGVNIFLALVTPILGGKKLLFPIPSITQQDVLFLKNLAEKGEFKPLLDRKYKLEEIVDAYKYVETGQKLGNVVLEIAYD